jgi:L-lactate dehydrogenase (cytochrome)
MRSRVERCLSLADFEREARRILPYGLYRFIAGGAEDARSVVANERAFDDWSLVPRVLVDTSTRSTETTFLGRPWSAPFGIAPMGATGVAAFRADLVLAEAAAGANVPFVLSSSSLVAMERVLAVNDAAWFQLYASMIDDENAAIVSRAAVAGFGTLVVTVDVPVAGNREEDVRNRYASPLRPSLRFAVDAALHPRWLVGSLARTLLHEGMPHFENLPTARVPMIARTATRGHRRDTLTWEHVARMRDRWRGRLVVKGVLAADDAVRAAAIGVDAIVVSNHGGRQLDGAIAPLHALPPIRAAVPTLPLLIDGGIRRGTQLLKAFGAGADFALIGRPFLYAAVVGGTAGVLRAIELLSLELDRDLALLGCRDPAEAATRIVPRVAGQAMAPSNP